MGTTKRNWTEYNKKLKRQASIEIFLHEDLLKSWSYEGNRKRGGIIKYRDSVIEMCLLIREMHGLALRQTEGFIQSILQTIKSELKVPDYSTMSRRASSLEIKLKDIKEKIKEGGLILAVDSTGLSVQRKDEWNREKHGRGDGKWTEKWRKLHVCIDVSSGTVLKAVYTTANKNDCLQLSELLEGFKPQEVDGICGDMAYDTTPCRREVQKLGARQLIPPIRKARLSGENRNHKKNREVLKERDEAILYIRNNTINGDVSSARALWKRKVGYHQRSLVETTMSRIKAHAGTKLTNRTEENRGIQAIIKCKLINILNAA
jgi:IS5 family transposase